MDLGRAIPRSQRIADSVPAVSTYSAPVWATYDADEIPSTTQISIDLLADVPLQGKVLDLGCGTGRNIAATAAAACRPVVGADVNFQATRRAHTQYKNVAESAFLTADANELPFKDHVFILAVAQAFLTVIPTLAERTNILSELCRVLVPGGYLYVGDFLQHDASAIYAARYQRGYELLGEYGSFAYPDADTAVAYLAHHFAEDELTDLLTGHGLSIVRRQLGTARTHSGNEVPSISLLSRLKI